MTDYTANHPAFSGPAPTPSATGKALSAFAAPAAESSPPRSSAVPPTTDDFYTVAGQFGLQASEQGPSESARWVVEYALDQVGVEGSEEFRGWLVNVLSGAARANGGTLRGAADARAYIEQSNSVLSKFQ